MNLLMEPLLCKIDPGISCCVREVAWLPIGSDVIHEILE